MTRRNLEKLSQRSHQIGRGTGGEASCSFACINSLRILLPNSVVLKTAFSGPGVKKRSMWEEKASVFVRPKRLRK